jgi:tetratricopeptide (TPR) repeat protein
MAEHLLWQSLSRDLPPADHELAKIYLGHVLANREQFVQAQDVWRYPAPAVCADARARCPHAGVRLTLEAEWALRNGALDAAQSGYAAALAVPLPDEWRTLAIYRLALLQAADDPTTARATLEQARDTTGAEPAPLLAPLLPFDARAPGEELYAVVQAAPADRPVLLGQVYVAQGLYALAIEQLAQVPATHPLAREAAALLARARLFGGQPQASLATLERLLTQHPDDPRAGSLVALTALTQDAPPATRALSETLAMLPENHAATHMAHAAWHVTRSEYRAASHAYYRALALAPAERRGEYALLIARFYLDAGYDICTDGLHAAAIATDELPDDAAAWVVRAGSAYYCGEYPATLEAARRALELDANLAEAYYYLGAALVQVGNVADGRQVLIQASDTAPASAWRMRAERMLDELAAEP